MWIFRRSSGRGKTKKPIDPIEIYLIVTSTTAATAMAKEPTRS